jgi:hypothetical protein
VNRADPLRPWLYLRRRFRQMLPIGLVITLVTLLLVVVITPSNTFNETTRANLRGLEVYTVVAPAGRPGFDSALAATLKGNPHMEGAIHVKALWVRYPMMIGEGSCPLILASPEDSRALVGKLGLTLVAGRYPDGPEPVMVLQEDVARARGLKVGSKIGSIIDPDDNIPGLFEVVGLVRGAARIAVGVPGSSELSTMLMARVPDFMLIYARPAAKEASDRYLHAARDEGDPAFQVMDIDYAQRRTERALKNLPFLVTFIFGSSSMIVALVAILLSLIALQARLPELAVLLAIGQRRSRLSLMLIQEFAVLAVLAWLLGVGLGLLGLQVYDAVALRPRGILFRVYDAHVLATSAALPVLVIAVGALALWRSLATVDPVTLIQKRGG